MKHEAKAPPRWGEDAMQHLKRQYKGDNDAAFGTAWTLHERGVTGEEYLERKKSVLNCAVKTAVDELFGKKANHQVPRLVAAIQDTLSEMEGAVNRDRSIVGGYAAEIRGYLDSILRVEEGEEETMEPGVEEKAEVPPPPGLMAAGRKGE